MLHSTYSRLLASLFTELNEREMRIITLRHSEDKPIALRLIADELKISGTRVGQIEKKALLKLGVAIYTAGVEKHCEKLIKSIDKAHTTVANMDKTNRIPYMSVLRQYSYVSDKKVRLRSFTDNHSPDIFYV